MGTRSPVKPKGKLRIGKESCGEPWAARGSLVPITAQPLPCAPPAADPPVCSLLLVPEWEKGHPKQLLCSQPQEVTLSFP